MTRSALLLPLLGVLALAGGARAHGDDMFDQMDRNHDGRISAQEHADGAAAMFRSMDADHDGRVTAAELEAGHAAWDKDKRGPHGDMPGMPHDGMPHDGRGHGGMGHGGMDAMMAAMDPDHDGIVTAAEHAAGAKAMFDACDANHDGDVTRAEMDAFHAGMGAGMDHGAHGAMPMDDEDMPPPPEDASNKDG